MIVSTVHSASRNRTEVGRQGTGVRVDRVNSMTTISAERPGLFSTHNDGWGSLGRPGRGFTEHKSEPAAQAVVSSGRRNHQTRDRELVGFAVRSPRQVKVTVVRSSPPSVLDWCLFVPRKGLNWSWERGHAHPSASRLTHARCSGSVSYIRPRWIHVSVHVRMHVCIHVCIHVPATDDL